MLKVSTLTIYQEILAINTEMLKAAQTGNREVFYELSNLCDETVRQIADIKKLDELSLKEIEQKISCLKKLLHQDDQISKIITPAVENFFKVIDYQQADRI